jgi:hypothetical protein
LGANPKHCLSPPIYFAIHTMDDGGGDQSVQNAVTSVFLNPARAARPAALVDDHYPSLKDSQKRPTPVSTIFF